MLNHREPLYLTLNKQQIICFPFPPFHHHLNQIFINHTQKKKFTKSKSSNNPLQIFFFRFFSSLNHTKLFIITTSSNTNLFIKKEKKIITSFLNFIDCSTPHSHHSLSQVHNTITSFKNESTKPFKNNFHFIAN